MFRYFNKVFSTINLMVPHSQISCPCKLPYFVPTISRCVNVMVSRGESTFPKTLEDFGYRFNEYGRLRQIDRNSGDLTDRGFEFNVSSEPDFNQKHYEAIGEVCVQTTLFLSDNSAYFNWLQCLHCSYSLSGFFMV